VTDEDLKALNEMHPPGPSIPDTREGYRKWRNWLVRNRIIKATEGIQLDVAFETGRFLFKSKYRYTDID
jgi:hypothetical protein